MDKYENLRSLVIETSASTSLDKTLHPVSVCAADNFVLFITSSDHGLGQDSETEHPILAKICKILGS